MGYKNESLSTFSEGKLYEKNHHHFTTFNHSWIKYFNEGSYVEC